MTLADVFKLLDQLSPDELREVKDYIDQREIEEGRGATPEERIKRLEAAAAIIREGMTQEELDALIADMNSEYIEPFDEEVWKD